MALPLPLGLTPPEIAFLCEMELVTVIPRQRMDSLPLLSGPTPPLHAARSAPLPLYLALLLHRQQRANIAPPPWLTTPSLELVLKAELDNPAQFSASPPWPSLSSSSRSTSTSAKYGRAAHLSREGEVVSPPFIPHSTATSSGASGGASGAGKEGSLPYHWLELSELLLASCPESFPDANTLRGLLRDVREVRQSKLRAGMRGLEGGGVVSLRGVGAMEVAMERGFVVGVVGGLRAVGASREAARREREGEEEDGGVGRGGDEEDDDEGMDF